MALNYLVLEGERYDFVKSKEQGDPCKTCVLKDDCDQVNEQVPCSAFLGRFDTTDYHFVKHVVKHKKLSLLEEARRLRMNMRDELENH